MAGPGEDSTSDAPASPAPDASAQPHRRGGISRWLIGGGFLGLVGLVVVLLVFFGILSATRPSDDAGSTLDDLHAHLDLAEAEFQKYEELAAQLEGNPVGALVTQALRFRSLQDRFQAVEESTELLTARVSWATELAQDALEFRQELERRIAAAEGRRENSSGTQTESLVDAAGNGFIDVFWDAPSACGAPVRGCVSQEPSEEPLALHIQPEDEASSDWAQQVTTLHELAHLYQRADADMHRSGSEAGRLLDQGMFEGSSEKMADCYALTYLDSWTLSDGIVGLGHGYVCDESERQAIREWAAALNAPMPG